GDRLIPAMPQPRQTLVVAGLSARWLAESAAQGRWRVIALDLFGDLDTRRVCAHWAPIGDRAAMALDETLLCEALAAARRDGATGWIAGSGFDASPALLAAGAEALPLLGMPADAAARVRDPHRFFATLRQHGLKHPQTRCTAPVSLHGWLRKRAGGSGGWHIGRAAEAGSSGDETYFQRELKGDSMSALFLADGRRAVVVALNRLIVRPLGRLPYVYRGAIGPIERPGLCTQVQSALDVVVPAFGLRGLASLDFVSSGGTPWLLEINPRPSASMALHAGALPCGLLRAHVAALRGVLPEAMTHASGMRGCETVFAQRPCHVDAALADEWAAAPHCHDLPAAGSRIAACAPICTVSAQAGDARGVERLLAERVRAVESRIALQEA
ncbi:MAG TPA: ATP-grasp domain-containing protein, partial [Burkholderiaceae bacterium]|nr:ATP-grasp domain-containing protein [Burkholderiaceae bacterium]